MMEISQTIVSSSEACSDRRSGDDESQPPTPLPAVTPATVTARESTEQGNWLIQIQTHLTLDLDHIVPITSCIFPAPYRYSSSKPESFAPQLIAVGPLHHFLNGLMLMETFKLGAAKRAQMKFELVSFHAIVKSLEALAPEIRACYAKQLAVTDHVLAWIMCIDGLFLLELLTCDGNICFNSSGRHGRVLLDSSETDKIQSTVLGDAVKLENQIPIFVLNEILSLEDERTARISIPLDFSSDPFPHNELVQFCVKMSPFPARRAYPHRGSEGIEPRHLLDLLYHLILLMGIRRPGQPHEFYQRCGFFEDLPLMIPRLWQSVGKGNQQFVKYITLPVTFALQLVEIFGISDQLKKLLEEEKSLIPSATKLKSAGVRFNPVATVRDISFEPAEKTLNLTEFTWRDAQTTGIVLKNLIAYESVTRPESPILAGYAELIHSLVRTAEDLAVLTDAGVIRFEKKEEKPEAVAVMALFIELGKLGEAKDKRVSETVAGVNDYYNGVLKVKLKAAGKKCLQYSWTILTVVAVVVLLGLFSLQTVCQVAECKDWFKISSSGQPASSVMMLTQFAGRREGDHLLPSQPL